VSRRLVLASALLAAPLAAAAADLAATAPECFAQAALQPKTEVEVVVSAYPTVFERRLDIPGINRLRPSQLSARVVAHGLSIADFAIRSTTKSETISWGRDGRVCAWVSKVSVDLTPESIRIYIPKDYPPGRCESDALSRHELEHEELFRRAVLRAADRMRDALARAPELAGPKVAIDAAGPAEASARLRRAVEHVVRPIYLNMIRISREEQDELDSPETYSRLGARCTGWKKT
jgi:hypothetical protein